MLFLNEDKLDVTSNYVYHVSNALYSDIRSLEYQNGRNKSDYNPTMMNVQRYFKEVNCFAGEISEEMVKLLRVKGFINWGKGKLYVYKIDLSKNRKSINHINIASTPEEMRYNNKNWDDFYDKNSSLNDDEWIVAKNGYLSKKDKHLESIGILKDMSIDDYLKLVKKKDWNSLYPYFKLNSMKGNKKQYASYIPHVQIDTNGPLVYESFYTLF